jgi:hypothetical protein
VHWVQIGSCRVGENVYDSTVISSLLIVVRILCCPMRMNRILSNMMIVLVKTGVNDCLFWLWIAYQYNMCVLLLLLVVLG